VQRALDAGPVIVTEMADLLDYVRDLLTRNFDIAERNLIDRKPRFGIPAEVENYLNKVADIFSLP
jgi:hypothetical protein